MRVYMRMYKEIYAPSQWKKKRNKKDNNDREVAQVPWSYKENKTCIYVWKL